MKRFLTSTDGAVLYQGLEIDYVPRETQVILTRIHQKEGEEESTQIIILSDMLPPRDFSPSQQDEYWHDKIQSLGFRARASQAETDQARMDLEQQKANKRQYQNVQSQLKDRKHKYATEHAALLQQLKRTEREVERLSNYGSAVQGNGLSQLRARVKSLQRQVDEMDQSFMHDRKALRRQLMVLQGMTPEQIEKEEYLDDEQQQKILQQASLAPSSPGAGSSQQHPKRRLTKLEQARLEQARQQQQEQQEQKSAPSSMPAYEQEELKKRVRNILSIDDEL